MIIETTRTNFVNAPKTQALELTKQFNQYQDYVTGKKILRFLRKKKKYAIREYHPPWWWIKHFKNKKKYWRKK